MEATLETIMQEMPTVNEKLSRQEMLRNHDIRISFCSSGCLVQVGCKSVAFSTNREAIDAIKGYIDDPIGKKKYWEDKFENL